MSRSYSKSRFLDQRSMATKRNIPFKFTFEEWDQWWLSQGIDRNIPQGKDGNCLCMCRFNDQGSYEPGNVYIDTNSNNVILRNKLYWSKRGLLHTPNGVFQSISDASNVLQMTHRQIRYRIKNNPSNYYYA